MNDRPIIRGYLTISAVLADRPIPYHLMPGAILNGIACPVYRSCNHIVDIGLEAIPALLGGGVGTPTVGGGAVGPSTFQDLRVFKMRITEQVAPTAPTDIDTALEGVTSWSGDTDGPPGPDALMAISYPALGQVRFSVVVPPTSKVGSTFTEEGLFTKSGLLVARTTGFDRFHSGAAGSQFDHTLILSRA